MKQGSCTRAAPKVNVTYVPCAAKLLNVATPLNTCRGIKPGILAPHNDVIATRATRRVCDNISE